MFDRIGSKIKGLASFITVIGIIASVVGGLRLISLDEELLVFGLLIMAVGSLAAWIGSFLLYGFGELIEKTCIIEERLSLHPHLQCTLDVHENKNTSDARNTKKTSKIQNEDDCESGEDYDWEEMLKNGVITEEEYREATKRG